jgi:hypothetical protein
MIFYMEISVILISLLTHTLLYSLKLSTALLTAVSMTTTYIVTMSMVTKEELVTVIRTTKTGHEVEEEGRTVLQSLITSELVRQVTVSDYTLTNMDS